MDTTAACYQKGFPISVEDIVYGRRKILCRLAWRVPETGEEQYSFWRTLEGENELVEIVQEFRDNIHDTDIHWIEYGYE